MAVHGLDLEEAFAQDERGRAGPETVRLDQGKESTL